LEGGFERNGFADRQRGLIGIIELAVEAVVIPCNKKEILEAKQIAADGGEDVLIALMTDLFSIPTSIHGTRA
jgi:hypothetical protein